MADPYQTPQLTKPKRALVITLFMTGLFMVIFIILAIALSGNDFTDNARKLTAQQAEILRVSQIGESHNSASQSVRNLASIVAAVSSSSINDLSGINGGGTLSREETSLYQDSAADTRLEDAALTNEFGAVFVAVLGQKIEQAILDSESLLTMLSDSQKPIVQNIIDDYKLVLEEIN